MIQAYVRLQYFLSKQGKTFVPRQRQQHGTARGEIRVYLVGSHSWQGARDLLQMYGVTGYTNVDRFTVEGFHESATSRRRSFASVPLSGIPEVFSLDRHRTRTEPVRLAGLGAHASLE